MKDVYTLDDLVSRSRLDEGAEQPARLAVLGSPVAHSLSPQLHQAALDETGTGGRYIRLEVPAGEVSGTLNRLQELEFIGANITVPHKFEALSAADEVDGAATMLGAVNTILFERGRKLAFNTDGPGFVRAIHEEFLVDVKDLRIMVVGAGGGAGGPPPPPDGPNTFILQGPGGISSTTRYLGSILYICIARGHDVGRRICLGFGFIQLGFWFDLV